MAQILPVEIDLVDVGFQRQIKRERVVINDAIFDVIQLTWNTCNKVVSARLVSVVVLVQQSPLYRQYHHRRHYDYHFN